MSTPNTPPPSADQVAANLAREGHPPLTPKRIIRANHVLLWNPITEQYEYFDNVATLVMFDKRDTSELG